MRMERAYGRRVEVAILVAIVAHAAAFLLAPPYVARPYRLEAAPLRLVAAGVPGSVSAASGVSSVAAPARPEPVLLTTRPAIVTEQLRLAGETRPEASGSVAGGGGGEGGGDLPGSDEGPPPVFYAFDSPPQVVSRVEPEYPLAARVSGAEGSVVLNANVDVEGHVTRVWVARATAPEALVQSAMDALYRFRFTPGSQEGVPVRCTVAVPFNFRLNIRIESNGGHHER